MQPPPTFVPPPVFVPPVLPGEPPKKRARVVSSSQPSVPPPVPVSVPVMAPSMVPMMAPPQLQGISMMPPSFAPPPVQAPSVNVAAPSATAATPSASPSVAQSNDDTNSNNSTNDADDEDEDEDEDVNSDPEDEEQDDNADEVDSDSNDCVYTFKRHDYNAALKNKRGRVWKSVRQMVLLSHLDDYPADVPTYISFKCENSRKPAKKFCDFTGLHAKYTDPTTGVRFCHSAHSERLRLLDDAHVDALLHIRGAHRTDQHY
ncbi:MAG: hypothetical protein MHM6MM_006018 [Cercozoa sp. M6MM]